MGSNASTSEKVLHSNRGRSINLQSFVEKRSAVQAIETSLKIILLCDIF
jgi:hypothetical protein